MPSSLFARPAVLCALLSLAACSSPNTPCTGASCADASLDAVTTGDGALLDALDAPSPDTVTPPPDVTPIEVSTLDVPTEAGPACANNDECSDDRHCVMGRCLAWERGEADPMCTRTLSRGAVRPSVQCAWTGAPEGDPHADEHAVLHTPLVANFGIRSDVDTAARPSVVFISDHSYSERLPTRGCGAAGTLRLIDGATCRTQASALDDGDRVNSSVTPAIGDLDGDGRPEIVAAAADGGILAFRVDPMRSTVTRLWKSTALGGGPDTFGATLCSWGGISLADLDDDGLPEVLYEGAVWSSLGVRLYELPGWQRVVWGSPMIAADIDSDGRAELVDTQGTWEWSPGTETFVRESFDTRAMTPRAPGHTALADFGDFPGRAGDAPGRPELVSVLNGHVTVLSLGGDVLLDLTAPMGSSAGGPPTIADYDGDGRPEIGVAFSSHYVVFDVNDMRTLWSQPSQDRSSARTGSSVFDFNADGRSEVVYGDECYLRVYDGTSGEVLFSQARFSSTWHENAIVADVDADGSAEVVIPSSGPCNPGYCPATDTLFAGLRCESNEDCGSNSCVEGLCRCTSDEQCGTTYACAAPADHPERGNVCRAAHRACEAGLRVYRDGRDRWAPARGIWNQHAYSITNVTDEGRIPRTSMARPSWSAAGGNSFRQNAQGGAANAPASDLTVGGLSAACEGSSTRLRASVCNRGQTFLDAGLVLVFRRMSSGDELCRLRTSEPVGPGSCAPVECLAMVPARGIFEATADPDGSLAECREGNNTARGEAFCGPG